MSDQRLLAARALLAKHLADEIAKEVKAVRGELEPGMLAGEKVVAVLPSGDIVGKVQLTEAPVSAIVVDPAALLDYVERCRPDEVVTTKAIRPGFLNWLLGEAKAQLLDGENTDGLVVDKDGEVIPGLELNFGTPGYRPEPSASGKRILAQTAARLLGAKSIAELLTLTEAES